MFIYRLMPSVLLVGFAVAQNTPPDLSGTWTLQSDPAVKLVFAQTGENLDLKELKGAAVQADFHCSTHGKDCKGKDEGEEATVSMWFNGPMLVVLETKKDVITKRLFALGEKGSTLKVQVTPISTGAKMEEFVYVKESASASAKPL